MRVGYILLSLLMSSGCSLFVPKATVPISVDSAQQDRESDTLIVMLPGRRSGEGDFRQQGFFDLVRDKGMDVLSVDGHFGYYMNRSITKRLHEDVIKPAREQGYTQIWLMGISLGGFGAILYAEDYPECVDGMFLLAPFTGDEKISEEIRNDGGLLAWNREFDSGKDYERRTWRRLQIEISRQDPPHVVLAYGISDRFADANAVIAEALPDSHVFTVEGGHNWDAWKPLWQNILDAGFPQRISSSSMD
ncbi:MAG: alpha/beta hydrolase [Xanthomonadaceae bacterium]|nr:alpha/beta hydrolase [Xanthomonadaceae bacterium]